MPRVRIFDYGPIYKNYCTQSKSLAVRDSIMESHWELADGIKDGIDIHLPSKV